MMRNFVILGLLAAIVVIPFLLRPEMRLVDQPDRTLVIVSPHNEAIRYEFSRAFSTYWKKQTGESVLIDWRTPGGTSEIARFLVAEYKAAFEYHWKNSLQRKWSSEVAAAFDDSRLELSENPAADTLAQQARREFLSANVSCGIDLFFGGGAYDFIQQAGAGRLVDCGVLERQPQWFGGAGGIPQELGGEQYYDLEGRWIGVCLSAFGIVYNRDALQRLGIERPPSQWSDLADPRYRGQIALADPTKSGSVAKAFEMLIQQQMQQAVARAGANSSLSPEQTAQAVARGWDNAMQLIIKISANARYFTDSASKIPIDVALGDAAAGMCIDFYGRFQSESLRREANSERMVYLTPEGGSSIGVDPIGLLRGAPDPQLAKAFIDFTLSLEGQKLWNFKVGTPGGPATYALRRLPIHRQLYADKYAPLRSDPSVNAYSEAEKFTYHPEWTARLFSVIRFVVRAMCLDPHDELRQAWISANQQDSQAAINQLLDVSAVSYQICHDSIRPVLRSHNRVDDVRLANELGSHFRQQYLAADGW